VNAPNTWVDDLQRTRYWSLYTGTFLAVQTLGGSWKDAAKGQISVHCLLSNLNRYSSFHLASRGQLRLEAAHNLLHQTVSLRICSAAKHRYFSPDAMRSVVIPFMARRQKESAICRKSVVF